MISWRDWMARFRQWWQGEAPEEMASPADASSEDDASPVDTPTVERTDPLSFLSPSPETTAGMALERAARQAYRRGRYEDCVELAQRSLEYDRSNLFAYHYLGISLAHLERWEEAEKHLRQAQEHADTLGLSSAWLERLAGWQAGGEPPAEWMEDGEPEDPSSKPEEAEPETAENDEGDATEDAGEEAEAEDEVAEETSSHQEDKGEGTEETVSHPSDSTL